MPRFNQLLFAPAWCLLLLSCSNNTHQAPAWRYMNATFESSSVVLKNQSAVIYRSLESRLLSEDSLRAASWNGTALKVKQYADKADAYIAGLIKTLKYYSGGEKYPYQFNEVATLPVRRLFFTEEKGAELFHTLGQLSEDMLSADPKIRNDMYYEIAFRYTGKDSNALFFTTTHFAHATTGQAIAELNGMRSRIRQTELAMATFCHSRSCSIKIVDDIAPQFLISQSSSVVSPGESISVTAGVGMYYDRGQMSIAVNHQQSKTAPLGVLTSKFRASLQPGVYRVPVKVWFRGPDQREYTQEKMITYRVVDTLP